MRIKNKVSIRVLAFLMVFTMLCGSVGINSEGITVNVVFADSSSSAGEESDSIYNIDADVDNIIKGIRNISHAHAPSYYTNDWVLGMAAAGLSLTSDEKEKYLANVQDIAVDSGTSVSVKAKTAIALTALNIDARQIANKNGGQAIDLINDVAFFDGFIDPVYTAPLILSLYDLHNYEIPNNALVIREKLIEIILEAQEPDGSWYGAYGSDSTGMVLPALAAYYNKTEETNGISPASCSAITAAVNNALDYLSNSQEIDGGFPGFGGMQNSNTMSTVIVGLNALGLNPHKDVRFIKNEKSAMQSLLSYRTSDDRLGYANNIAPDDFACQQGLGALATYQNLNNSRSSNLYGFTKEIAPYTNWPNADLLTSIRITPPTQTVYSYDAAKTNDTVNTEGMSVTAVYNGDPENVSDVPLENCTISTIDRSKPGTHTVTVSYNGCTAFFMITVLKSDGAAPSEDTVSITVKNNNKTIASNNSLVIEEDKTSVLDVLKMLLDAEGISYVIKQNGYISEIDGLGEFDLGSNSGWLYSVNGIPPSTISAKDYKLKDGDVVLWYYTSDFTEDKSTYDWRAGEIGLETGTSQQTVVIEAASKVDDKGKAIAYVSVKDVASALEDALQSAGGGSSVRTQIIVQGADAANSIELIIPNSSIKELSTKADGVTINMPIADISLVNDTLNALAAESGKNVRIIVAKLETESVNIQNLSEEVKAEIGVRPVYDFSIMSDSNNISEFDGKIIITLPYTASQQEKGEGLIIYFLKDNGIVEVVKNCIYDSKSKTMTFTTRHLSNYALAYKELNFTDTADHWAEDHIKFLAVRNIVKGMTETSFSPNSNITRAQFVQMLANLAGKNTEKNTGNNTGGTLSSAGAYFTDVKETAWYAGAIEWAVRAGIVKGIKNNDGSMSFHPDINISRQDLAVLISRFNEKYDEYNITAIKEAVVFQDENKIADYAADAVKELQQAGLIDGKTSNIYAPIDYATRAESAKMIATLIRNTLQSHVKVVKQP
jgi:hypothetical protein